MSPATRTWGVAENEDYLASSSHWGFVQTRLSASSSPDKMVFVVESKDGKANAIAGGALLDPKAFEKCASDADTVKVYFVHTSTTSKSKKLTLSGGQFTLRKEIKKLDVYDLPVMSLLAKYEGKDVKTWSLTKGSSEKNWDSAMVNFKGRQAIANGTMG